MRQRRAAMLSAGCSEDLSGQLSNGLGAGASEPAAGSQPNDRGIPGYGHCCRHGCGSNPRRNTKPTI